MEEIYNMFVPSMVNGYLNGFRLLWQSLIQHPFLLAFFAFLLGRKIKQTFFG